MSTRATSNLAAGIHPEAEILLCCARTRLDPATTRRLQALLRAGPDWALLLRLAELHGLRSLLYWNLSRTCPGEVPEAVRDQLARDFAAGEALNRSLATELLHLLDLLARYEIPALPYKGPVLAERLYGNLALRQFSDLDLLVHPQEWMRARDLLLAQGYRPGIPMSREAEAAHLRVHRQYRCLSADGRVRVELHWGLSPLYFPFPYDFDQLSSACRPVPFSGRMVPDLPPEELLVILCLHATKHCWGRLNWICDIAALIGAYPELDWQRLVERAGALGGLRMLCLGLLLARDLLGATVPQEVWPRLRTGSRLVMLAGQVCRRLFREGEGASFRLQMTTYLRVRERFRDRYPFYRYLLSVTLTPTHDERALLPLPAALSFLYYLVRPIRLAVKFVLRLDRSGAPLPQAGE